MDRMTEQGANSGRFPETSGNVVQPDTVDVSAAELRAALNGIVRDSLRPAALGISLIYVVLALSYYLRFSSSVALPLVILAAGMVVTLLVVYLALGRWQIPLRWANPAAAGIAGLVLVNTVAQHAYARPQYYSNYSLLIVGVGFLILDARWLAAILVATNIGWATTIQAEHLESGVVEFLLQVAGAVVLAVLVHSVRVQMLRRMERLRLQDAQRRTLLAEAVLVARQNEERFRKLSNATFEGIVVHDRGRVLDSNQTLLDMFGYTFEEVVGRQVLDFLSPGAREQARANIQAEVETPYEAVGVRRDGSEFPIEVCGKMITHDGRVARVVTVRDITERKRAEAERERLIKELDAFARTVAHDLKNPLSLVVAYTYLLLEDIATVPPADARSYLNEIANGAFKMNSIIDELLLLAQMRHGDVKLHRLDMAAIVLEAWHGLGLLRKERGIDIITLPDDWPPSLGYAPWVEQVWINYLSNAIKYGGSSSRISVGADAQQNGMVRYCVRDHGDGLTAAQQARLFAPFTQLEHSRTGGHGLGLSIVRRIVERLGGQVGVDCADGEGCEFWFTLPGCGSSDGLPVEPREDRSRQPE